MSQSDVRCGLARNGCPNPTHTSAAAIEPIRARGFIRWLVTGLCLIHVGALAAPTLPLAADPAGRITNFSARAYAGTGGQSLTLGFVVSGGSNAYLLRAIGPSLAAFGVNDALADPWLHLYSGTTKIQSNNNWGGAFIAPNVAAFALDPNSLDAAILASLNSGAYTAQVGTGGSSGGIALGEIYDLQMTASRLTNLSARAPVGTGEAALLGGFAISGSAPRTVLIRAIGPSLQRFGIGGALAVPKLELIESGLTVPFAVGIGGAVTPLSQVAATQCGAFPLASDAKDAVMLVSLAPGTYTARVSGGDGGTGVALLELYDQPVWLFPLTGATNVIYDHGDMMKYSNVGEYVHADGSKTVITGGWLRLEIFDQGLQNPLNNNLPVLSLVETLLYEGAFVAPDGASTPVRVVGFPTTRYFVQDANGTIKYQGDRLPEGTDANGAPIFHTYWFASDYIQYAAPFVVGATKISPFTRNDLDRGVQKSATMTTTIEGIETATGPLGNFSTYRVRYRGIGNDPANNGVVIDSHTQNIYPDIGIVRFDFASTTPGDTGAITMNLSETNLPYLGGNVYPLIVDLVPRPLTAGQYSKYDRSGYYMANDGTIEEISGWMTREVKDEGVVNPATNHRVLTIVETHETTTEATTLSGQVTRSTIQQVVRFYAETNVQGATVFVGETNPAGRSVWFDQGWAPLVPSGVGQTMTQTVTASTWSGGQGTAVYNFTPTMTAVSVVPVHAKLGTFSCYRMAYADSTGIRRDEFVHYPIGVVKFSYPAPDGKFGHMDLTLSATNISFP